MTEILGVGVEGDQIRQARGGSRGALWSSFSPEDLISNHHGSQLGRRLLDRPGTEPVETFLAELSRYVMRLRPVPREHVNIPALVRWYGDPSRRRIPTDVDDALVRARLTGIPDPDEVLRPEYRELYRG